jgi:hypothetical protein
MSERITASRFSTIPQEEHERIADRERELLEYRQRIEVQQRDFDAYRRRVQEEQLKREADFQKELDAREKMFSQRERKLTERQRDFEENLLRRQSEAEALRVHLQGEIASREKKLQEALIEIAHEKDRYNEESRKKIFCPTPFIRKGIRKTLLLTQEGVPHANRLTRADPQRLRHRDDRVRHRRPDPHHRRQPWASACPRPACWSACTRWASPSARRCSPPSPGACRARRCCSG